MKSLSPSLLMKAAVIVVVAWLLLIGIPNLLKPTEAATQSNLRPTAQSGSSLFPSDVRPSPQSACISAKHSNDPTMTSDLQYCGSNQYVLVITPGGGFNTGNVVSCTETTAANPGGVALQAYPFLGGHEYNCFPIGDWLSVSAIWYSSDDANPSLGNRMSVTYQRPVANP